METPGESETRSPVQSGPGISSSLLRLLSRKSQLTLLQQILLISRVSFECFDINYSQQLSSPERSKHFLISLLLQNFLFSFVDWDCLTHNKSLVCVLKPTRPDSDWSVTGVCVCVFIPGSSFLAASSAILSSGPEQGQPGSSSIPALPANR